MKKIAIALGILVTLVKPALAFDFFGGFTRSAVNYGNGGSAATIDWSKSPAYLIELNGSSLTLTFTAPARSADLNLIIDPGVAGVNGAITWPATVDWTAGTAPTISNGDASVYDWVDCHYNDAVARYMCEGHVNMQ